MKCNVKIAEYNSQITQINLGEEVSSSNPIGFCYTPTEKEDEQVYEDD
jgi:hypothetical protein